MIITTWNVNGIRARLTHVIDFLREQRPDVLCLQETKVVDEQFPREMLEDEGYNVVTFGQKSYNGVAILSRRAAEDTRFGLPDDGEDGERRLLGATFGDWMVVNLYVPNGQALDSPKYGEKLEWLRRLRAMLDAHYSAQEKVVLVGDFNVALDDRDVYDPDGWRDQIHCSTPEREAIRHVMGFGLADLLRKFHDEPGIYTWWHYMRGDAFKDKGLRIDYQFATPPAAALCREVTVHRKLRLARGASDHAPVTAVFAD